MPVTPAPCPLCLSTMDARPEPDKTWFAGFRGAPELVRCRDCSLVYLRDYESEVVHTRDDDYVRVKILQSYNEPPRDHDKLFPRRLDWAKTRVRGRRVLD